MDGRLSRHTPLSTMHSNAPDTADTRGHSYPEYSRVRSWRLPAASRHTLLLCPRECRPDRQPLSSTNPHGKCPGQRSGLVPEAIPQAGLAIPQAGLGIPQAGLGIPQAWSALPPQAPTFHMHTRTAHPRLGTRIPTSSASPPATSDGVSAPTLDLQRRQGAFAARLLSSRQTSHQKIVTSSTALARRL